VSGQLYPRGKSSRYPLDRRLGGSQSRSGRRGEKKILDPTGTYSISCNIFNGWILFSRFAWFGVILCSTWNIFFVYSTLRMCRREFLRLRFWKKCKLVFTLQAPSYGLWLCRGGFPRALRPYTAYCTSPVDILQVAKPTHRGSPPVPPTREQRN
jgi:hypothetical protein